MSEIFLGKPWHWLMLVAVTVCFWVTGEFHLHVSVFNVFLAILASISVILVFAVVKTHRTGDRVTREPLPEPDADV